MTDRLLRPVARRAKRALRSLVRSTGGRPKTESATVDPQVAALVAAKVIDAGFYGAQVGVKFENRREAAAHYLQHGAGRELMFHPLINPKHAPEHVRQAWKDGQMAMVVDYLFSERGVTRAWSTLFDPRALSSGGGEDRVAPVRKFFDELSGESVLPVSRELQGRELVWGPTRRELLAAARRIRGQRRLTRTRTTKRWDEVAERAWLDALGSPPDRDGIVVTVVMPVWNRADRVLEAIASVQQQTFAAWELVAVDDGSDDDSLEVLRRAAALDDRIVVVAAEHRGVAAARNAALERARGRYVAFLDSDNSWRPHFLAAATTAVERSGARNAYAAVRLMDGDGGELFRAFKGGLKHLLVVNHIDLNVLIVETALAREIGGFDESLRRWVDHDFAIKAARVVEPVLLPFVACDYDDAPSSSNRITVTESDHWQYVVLGNSYVDWPTVEASVVERVPGRVSIVIPTYQDSRMTTAAVSAVVAHSGDTDVEIIVVDNDSHPHYSIEIAALAIAFDQVRVERLPRNLNFAIGSNVGFARSSGEFVLFLNNDTEVRAGWLDPLLERIADLDVRGVQPLLVYPDDTIQAAGTIFPAADAMPIHLMAGYPPEDAQRLSALPFSAVTAAAMLVRASEIAALRGFDPIYVNGSEDIDLCLRAVRESGGHYAVEPRSVVTHKESKTPGRGARIAENRRIFLDRWRGALPGPELSHFEAVGLEVVHLGSAGGLHPAPVPHVRRRPHRVTQARGSVVPQLRWNIKNAAVPGPPGDEWGDTHFIESLSNALRAAGQEVVTSRHGAHTTPQHAIDDVNLVIRGLDRVPPQPGKTNVLWVISHPDDVTVEEVRQFDLVFAASLPWARHMSELSGCEVRPLLQATDPSRFHPPVPEATRGDRITFVGQARRSEPRKIVMDALGAGLDLDVWGPRWGQHIDASHIRGSYFPNERLGSMYRSSALVLNDHWSDMRASGFISNRLFDAVACGARIVSDDVDGVEEIFEGSVRVYRTAEDLEAFRDPRALVSAFPDDVERAAIARRVIAEHSFMHRAEQLLAAVVEHRRAAQVGRRATARSVATRERAEVHEPERRCVYTALFGGYERPTPQPAFGADPIARILFTDDPAMRSDDWEVRIVERALPADSVRSSRWPKVLPHLALPDFDVSLYIDNSVQLRVPPSRVIDDLLPAEAVFALLAHSYRGSVLEEVEAVIPVKFDSEERIREQVAHYADIAPDALSAQTLWGGMLLRRHHDPVVVEAMQVWWRQILRYSRRDQLSLPYALQVAGLQPTIHLIDNKESDLHTWPVAVDRVRQRAFTA